MSFMTKYHHFGLVGPRDIVPEVLWFVQLQLRNSAAALLFFLEMRSFLWQSPKTSYTCSLLSY